MTSVHLYELALEQALKALDQLERVEDGRAVVEALVEHRAEPALQLLDRRAEGEEGAVERFVLHVEHLKRGKSVMTGVRERL